MSRRRAVSWIILAGVVLAGVVFWLFPFRDKLYADTASQVSQPEPPETERIPDPSPFSEIIESVEVEEEVNAPLHRTEVWVNLKEEPPERSDLWEALPRLEMSQNGSLELPNGGTFRLAGMTVFRPLKSRNEIDREPRELLPIYNADLEIAKPEDLSEAERERLTKEKQNYGWVSGLALRALYTIEGGGELHAIRSEWRDAETLYQFPTGRAPREEGKGLLYRPRFAHYRAAPVYHDLVVAYTAPEVEEIAVKKGETVEFSSARVSLLEVVPLHGTGGMGTSGGPDEKTFAVTWHRSVSGDPTASGVVYAISPPVRHWAIEMEYVRKDGTTLSQGMWSYPAGGQIVSHNVRAVPDDLQTIRIKYYPHLANIRVRYDMLPDAERFASNVDNLFHTIVPYAEISTPGDFQRFLESASQTTFTEPPARYINTPIFPPGYFPKEFSQMTVGEMAEEYLSYYPQGTDFRSNPEKRRLEIDTSTAGETNPLIEWFEKLLGK